jgi:UDP-N-acetylmuramoyl-L-alanyl-D-glutamate--2,6-diaminopimelate ligase
MGAVAGRLADVAVLTSDNPRSEEPLAIMAEVEAGLRQVHEHPWTRSEAERAVGRGYVAIADRREAIEFAVSLLETGDILLVAGKGHEDYQIVGSQRLHFDDREELRRALSGAAGAA